jgi:hypothetical protein
MGRRHKLSLRTSLWLAVAVTVASTVLGASALYGYQLYRSARQLDRLRVRAIAETYAAQVEHLTAHLLNERSGGLCGPSALASERLPVGGAGSGRSRARAPG